MTVASDQQEGLTQHEQQHRDDTWLVAPGPARPSARLVGWSGIVGFGTTALSSELLSQHPRSPEEPTMVTRTRQDRTSPC